MKQKFELEIDCPEGCKPISDKPDWKEIKTVEQVLDYCKKYFYQESVALINNLNYLDEQDYEYWIILYRLIVMAITDNEEISLTKGDILSLCSVLRIRQRKELLGRYNNWTYFLWRQYLRSGEQLRDCRFVHGSQLLQCV